jgi:integrase
MGIGSSWNLATEKMLTKLEMQRMLDAAKADNPRNYVAYITQANTGLRVSEVVHLKKADLLPGFKLRVTRRKKRSLSPSVLDIMPAVWNKLSEWAAQNPEGEYIFAGNAGKCIIERSKKGVKQTPEEFCQGGHIHLRTLQTRWRLLISTLGMWMKGRGVHQMRHYFATELYAKTRDLRLTQVALAHSSSAMTERYAHVVDYAEKLAQLSPTI